MQKVINCEAVRYHCREEHHKTVYNIIFSSHQYFSSMKKVLGLPTEQSVAKANIEQLFMELNITHHLHYTADRDCACNSI